MCETCGCGDPALMPVEVHERILAGNDAPGARTTASTSARTASRRST